jgi:hypothetical protein
MDTSQAPGFNVAISHITVFIMKYGKDVVHLHTVSHVDPLNFEGDTEKLDLQFRAPRMQGEAYARSQWPDANIRVTKWSEKTVFFDA